MNWTITAVNEFGSLSRAARIRRFCLLTALATVLPAFAADARPAFNRDQDTYPSYYQEEGRHHARPRRHKGAEKADKQVRKEAAKPQGSLIVAISIDNQRMKVYDTNGVYAESKISTGMRGHPTPMGVFSVIQKQRFHRSNIYSDAPMPFMQRITWSGVAMHAGVVPGYPASHGCIRLPAAFATKIWTWTRLGARVIVTPGEITPARFSHNLLTSLATAPQPPASPDPTPVSDLKSSPVTDSTAPAAGHNSNEASNPVPASPSGPIVTASAPATVATDAAVNHNPPPTPVTPAEKITTAPETMAGDPPPAVTASTEANASAPATQASDAAATQNPSPPVVTAETMANASAAMANDPPAVVTAPAERSANTPASVAGNAAVSQNPQPPSVTASIGKLASAAPSVASDAAVEKKTPPVSAPKLKRNPPIAIFISRKDSKIYVRQNFAPLFSAPVTIAASDRPLGTHVFTAEADPDTPDAARWSVVSLPLDRRLERRADNEERSSRRHRRHAAPPPEKPKIVADTPAEALDRITIPPETLARINGLFSATSSLVISDQGINQGETGEGTDFIVRLW